MGDKGRKWGTPSHPNLQRTAWASPFFLRLYPEVADIPLSADPSLFMVSPSVSGV